MNKLKILFGIIALLLFGYTLGIIQSIILLDNYQLIVDARKSEMIFGEFDYFIDKLLIISICAGLIICLKCIYEILKKGFFTTISKKHMKYAGYIFLIVGTISAILDSIRFFAGNLRGVLLNNILIGLLVGLLGFIVLIIADMARTGYQLKSENDLTI